MCMHPAPPASHHPSLCGLDEVQAISTLSGHGGVESAGVFKCDLKTFGRPTPCPTSFLVVNLADFFRVLSFGRWDWASSSVLPSPRLPPRLSRALSLALSARAPREELPCPQDLVPLESVHTDAYEVAEAEG